MWRARAKKIDTDTTLTSSQYALHSMTFSYICWKKFQGSLLWGAFPFCICVISVEGRERSRYSTNAQELWRYSPGNA